MEDDDINKEMKSSVAQDIKNLEDDWAKLKDADTDEEQRLNFADVDHLTILSNVTQLLSRQYSKILF